MEDGELYPKKELDLLPDKFLCRCGCKTLGVRAMKAAKRSPNLHLGESGQTFDDLRYVEFSKKVIT